jgi:PAS domain S-box-containing protein
MSKTDTPELISKLARAGGSEGALLHFLLENIPVKIYFKDTESRFIRVSRAMAQLFGYTSGYELLGKTDFDLFTPEHAEPAFADEQQVMRTGIPITDKVEKETLPNGEVRWAMTTKMPLRNSRGEIIGTCGISQDATAQKRLEEALEKTNHELREHQRQLERALADLDQANKNLQAMQQQLLEAEKMQALSRFAYGVAHEVRNPLNTLHMGVECLSGLPGNTEGSTQQIVLQEMKTAVHRADAVIKTLMETISPSDTAMEERDPPRLLEQVLAGLETELQSREIQVRTELAPDLPPLRVDAAKIEQVFLGLVTNSIDAMPEGGELTIRMGRKILSPEDIGREAGSRSAEKYLAGHPAVIVEIEDTGRGLPPDVRPKIFDPFFTTKETGHGTGLGLTVCRKFIELHRGILLVSNRGDRSGVRATILLPITT